VPRPSADWQAEWDRTVGAARREGQLVVSVGQGELYRQFATEFQKKYPDITLQVTPTNANAFIARVERELQAGQHLWDVYTGAPTVHQLRDAGGFDQLRSALILPEVLDDAKWRDGFEAGWNDSAMATIWGYVGRKLFLFYVNRDLVPESQLLSVEQLIEPAWKGKMVATDLAAPSAANAGLAHLLLAKGEDFVRKLLQQNMTVVSDRRQQAEFVVRGRYPIGMGLGKSELELLQREGLGKNVKPLAPDNPLGAQYTTGNGNVALMKQAPHPNAAKVFINWLLSAEGQTLWTRITGDNSRRLDVEGPADTVPLPGSYNLAVEKEQNLGSIRRAIAIAKEVG